MGISTATSQNKRFFIALLPPVTMQDYVNQVKQHVADRYNSRAAQKSPPHITLQAPFAWPDDTIPTLEQNLRQFARTQSPLAITLDGFAAFPPRVIYIDIANTPQLLTLHQSLAKHLEESLGIADPQSRHRPFTPHMTVAFRDLSRPNFKLAWQEFEGRSLRCEFVATHLTLLLHDGHRWNVYQEFPFGIPINPL